MNIIMLGAQGTGKGTVTRYVAEKLKLVTIDTGALYRCVTLEALNNKVDKDSNYGCGDFCYSMASKKDGWLLCDGSSYLQSDYPALFECLGTKFGGDETSFNVPDLRGRFLQMVSADAVVGDMKDAGLPNITGKATSGFLWDDLVKHEGALNVVTNTMISVQKGYPQAPDPLREINIDASRSSSIYGNSDTVQPPSLMSNVFIKY